MRAAPVLRLAPGTATRQSTRALPMERAGPHRQGGSHNAGALFAALNVSGKVYFRVKPVSTTTLGLGETAAAAGRDGDDSSADAPQPAARVIPAFADDGVLGTLPQQHPPAKTPVRCLQLRDDGSTVSTDLGTPTSAYGHAPYAGRDQIVQVR